MPELPEVEIVRRGLEAALSGARLTRVEVRRADLRFPLPTRFAERLGGVRVEALSRRGKHIVMTLEGGQALIVHLGMTGRFLIEGPSRPHGSADAHAHVLFHTDRGQRITYFDPRRFGSMDLIAADRPGEHPRLARLGLEPLAPEFTADALGAGLAGRRAPIKSALLDQRLVAGLGNIYVCEALHRAGISPLRAGGRIARARLARLVQSIGEVLTEAIAAGGSTLKDYAAADGASGYFQHRFAVYGREGEPCPRPGCSGRVRRTVQSGRSSFHCPKCQR